MNFTVTLGGTTLADCTAPVAVSTTDGTATCTFTPSAVGTYTIQGSFSGTDTLQPSTGSVTVSVLTPTTTTISVNETSQSHGQRTLTINANVTPSSATGSVTFTLCMNPGWQGCQQSYNGNQTLSSGAASWSQNGLSSGRELQRLCDLWRRHKRRDLRLGNHEWEHVMTPINPTRPQNRSLADVT